MCYVLRPFNNQLMQIIHQPKQAELSITKQFILGNSPLEGNKSDVLGAISIVFLNNKIELAITKQFFGKSFFFSVGCMKLFLCHVMKFF